MKSSVNIYFIFLVFIFILYKKKRKENNSNDKTEINKTEIKENFTNPLSDPKTYKSGKYTAKFRFYNNEGTDLNNNPQCESSLIGEYPPTGGNDDPNWANHNVMEAQPYSDMFGSLSSKPTIDHEESAIGLGQEYRCKRQYAIYLDERFPQKPYAALHESDFIGKGELDPTEFSLSYKKNISERHKLDDYIVVPIPNIIEKDSGEKELSDEPSYVLLRYKDKPINANWVESDTQHKGYCNNYVNCSGNMLDYSNPKCLDVKVYDDREKGTFKYYQNGTQIA